MEAFPFSEAEWAAIHDAALPVVNATLASDSILRASHLVDLLCVLHGLRARYGDHPVLLETEADFTEDDGERVGLYQRATEIASAHKLPTLSIRLALARVLLALGRSNEARAELGACARELPNSEDAEREEWLQLVANCGTPSEAQP